MNGKNVTGDVKNLAGTNMTIKDNSESKTGKIVGTITNNDQLTLESGNFSAATIVTEENAKTVINGGTYSSIQLEDVAIPADKELKANDDNTYTLDYKDADYTAVNEAKDKYSKLDKTKYTEESFKVLTDAVNAVVEGKNITEQAQVDEMAANIEKAIAGLKLIYNYTEGAKQEATIGNEVIFKIDAELSKALEVYVDGNVISKDNYSLASGSTIVTLNKDYVATLSEGEHSIKVEFSDGIAETTFTLAKQVTDDEKTDEQKPDENKPTEEKPDENKPTEEQPAEDEKVKDDNKKEEENPYTLDSILGYSLMGLVSIIGLAGCAIYVYKSKANSKH